ncbi:MAG: nucleoside monophosphate kinase, partial [Opitutaceae bacterium]
LLDGFPRTVVQAEALGSLLRNEGIGLDGVISYELPVEKIVNRIAGRRVCSKCKHSYHITDLPPKVAGVCDLCGGSLYQRDDDHSEAVRVRLAVYEKSTSPLIKYYEVKGLLFHIACADRPEETFKRSLKALGIS